MVAFSGKIHVTFPLLLWMYFVSQDERIFFVINPIWLCLGALFPDSDHRKAPMGRILPLWIWCKHRGFTHTWFGLLLFSGLISLYDLKWGWSFAIGYISHLILDATTPSGVNWFGKRKRTT